MLIAPGGPPRGGGVPGGGGEAEAGGGARGGGSGGDAGRNRPPDAITPSVLWYIETGICSQYSFSRDATGLSLKFSVGKSEEQQFFHRYLQKSDRSFVRGHYNTDLQEYNESNVRNVRFSGNCDCGYGADMVV